MVEKEYKVKAGSRIIAIAIGFAFAAAGALVLVQGNWVGAILLLIGLVVFWMGLRPNRLLITSDAVETHSLSVNRYPYAQIRRVRMVARRFFHNSSRSVNARGGGVTVKIAAGASRYRMYPEIQIEGDFPAPLILEVAYAGQLRSDDGQPIEGSMYRFKNGSRYDVQRILADILDRLPAGVEVDAGVQSYVATGSLPDVLSLPVENPKVPFGAGA
jgi:hypothetical protein